MIKEYLIEPSNNSVNIFSEFTPDGFSLFNPSPYSVYVSVGSNIPSAGNYDYIALPGQFINASLNGTIQLTVKNTISANPYIVNPKIQLILYKDEKTIPFSNNSLIPLKPVDYLSYLISQSFSPGNYPFSVYMVPLDRIAKLKYLSVSSTSTSNLLNFFIQINGSQVFHATMALPIGNRLIPLDISIPPLSIIDFLVSYSSGAAVSVTFVLFFELYSQ